MTWPPSHSTPSYSTKSLQQIRSLLQSSCSWTSWHTPAPPLCLWINREFLMLHGTNAVTLPIATAIFVVTINFVRGMLIAARFPHSLRMQRATSQLPPGLEQTNNGSDGDDFDPMYVVGVSLAALSALISSVALLIMKRSADTEAGLPLRPSCTHRWRRLWWLGFLMNTGSEVSLSVVALGMAPISVIAPIFGLAIVFSAVLARLGWVPGVKESLSRAEWASIVVIVVGIGLCSAFGPSTEHEIAFEDIGKYFGRASFLGYACPAAAFVLFW
ncbi:hypothetical protein EMIHUDRAFT_249736, partial [Emiliania huxleyi CCMP1516]|uniref:EamA domain-containing protein n=2 Tax=Emiliania huxleyi TaxID=2903 RepID=A0A0D3I5Z4_EMIH1